MEAASREEIEAKIEQLSVNWINYGMAERASHWEDMNKYNREHREIVAWLAEHGLPWHELAYNAETLTFALPSASMAMASM